MQASVLGQFGDSETGFEVFRVNSGGSEACFGSIQGVGRPVLGQFRGFGGMFWASSRGLEACFGPVQEVWRPVLDQFRGLQAFLGPIQGFAGLFGANSGVCRPVLGQFRGVGGPFWANSGSLQAPFGDIHEVPRHVVGQFRTFAGPKLLKCICSKGSLGFKILFKT